MVDADSKRKVLRLLKAEAAMKTMQVEQSEEVVKRKKSKATGKSLAEVEAAAAASAVADNDAIMAE